MEPGNPLLDEYVLWLCRRKKPKVCFFPSASGDADHYVVRFYRHFSSDICDPSHISLFRRDCGPGQVREHLLKQDLIYVGGGSILSLLGVWRAHGIDEDLRAAWQAGVILVGVSAGSLCWFASGLTAYHHDAKPYDGLGFLPHSNAVHYEEESNRRPAYHAALLDGIARRIRGLRRGRTAFRRRGPAPRRALAPGGAGVPGRGGRRRGRRAPAGGDLSRRATEARTRSRLKGGPRSSPWAGAASRWSRRTPPWTTTCSGWRARTLPKICLLPTASGDGEAQIRQFHATFGSRALRADAHLAVPARLAPDPAARDAARAGHRLRRRRVDARAARRLARARAGRDPARVLGVRRDPGRPVGGRDVLVRVGRDEVAGHAGALARPRLPARARSRCTWTASPPACRSAARRSPTARSRPATPPTTASRCSSAAPSSTRSSARARTASALRIGPDGEERLDPAPARARRTASAPRPRSPSTARRATAAQAPTAHSCARRPVRGLQSICLERWKFTPQLASSGPWAASRVPEVLPVAPRGPADLGDGGQAREDHRVDVVARLGRLGPQRGLDAEHVAPSMTAAGSHS